MFHFQAVAMKKCFVSWKTCSTRQSAMESTLKNAPELATNAVVMHPRYALNSKTVHKIAANGIAEHQNDWQDTALTTNAPVHVAKRDNFIRQSSYKISRTNWCENINFKETPSLFFGGVQYLFHDWGFNNSLFFLALNF